MNCDQVFMILTRGPFPSGDATDDAVEIHLASCNDCRRFADALRPDAAIFEECLVPEESRGLPYYWGVSAVLEEQSSPVATALGRRMRRRHRRTISERDESFSRMNGWQLAIAVLMGAALGVSLRVLGYVESREPIGMASIEPTYGAVHHADAAVYMPVNARQQLAAKLGVAPACWQDQPIHLHGAEQESQSAAFYSLSRNADLCCTKCHNATAPRFALRGTTARISRSCQVCHYDVPMNDYDPSAR